MKKGRLCVNLMVVFLSLLLVFPAGMVAAASTKAKISHEKPGDTYIPGFRIHLDADISDASGILTARCYFKAKRDKNFAFIKMMGSGGPYKAILPAPFVGSEEIHYLFVSVNKAKQVTRTEIFTLKETETKEGIRWKDVSEVKEVRLDRIQDAAEKLAILYERNKAAYIDQLAQYQTASSYGPIEVGTELPTNQVQVNGFYDRAMVREVPAAKKYGLAAKGLYTPEAVSAAGGTGSSGSVFAGTVKAGGSSTGLIAGVIGVGVVAGGAALAAGGSSSGGGGGGGSSTPTTGGITAADIAGTWSLSGASSDWHSASSGPYVFTSGGTYSGLSSSAAGPRTVSGTWSIDETAQTFTMTESTGYGATITNAAITGSAAAFTVQGQLPANGYTNNSGTYFAPNTSDTFTFTKQ